MTMTSCKDDHDACSPDRGKKHDLTDTKKVTKFHMEIDDLTLNGKGSGW
jgi:hypothetical protein